MRFASIRRDAITLDWQTPLTEWLVRRTGSDDTALPARKTAAPD